MDKMDNSKNGSGIEIEGLWKLKEIQDRFDLYIFLAEETSGTICEFFFRDNVYIYRCVQMANRKEDALCVEKRRESDLLDEIKRKCYDVWPFSEMFHMTIFASNYKIDIVDEMLPQIRYLENEDKTGDGVW